MTDTHCWHDNKEAESFLLSVEGDLKVFLVIIMHLLEKALEGGKIWHEDTCPVSHFPFTVILRG